jgi:ATP-dependent Lhr-like helicase
VEEALAELVALGVVNSDSFGGLRALLVPSDRRRSAGNARRRRRIAISGMQDAGRWSMVRRAHPSQAGGLQDDRAKESVTRATSSSPSRDPEALEHVCRTLLRRWGVVFWKLLEREADWLPPWREMLMCLRRLEARGEVRGGLFVSGFSGEQFALPEAIGPLREARRKAHSGELISLSGADPLNLVGVITPGARVPALTGNRVLYRDGVPIAVYVAGEVRFLEELETTERWAAQNGLLRRKVPEGLGDLA